MERLEEFPDSFSIGEVHKCETSAFLGPCCDDQKFSQYKRRNDPMHVFELNGKSGVTYLKSMGKYKKS